MKNKKLKFGIVGLNRGLIAKCLIKRGDIVLSAICDKREDRLIEAQRIIAEEIKRQGRKYTVKAYTSFDEMLKSDVDAMLIATDADKHTPLVIKAMEAGKHVISEIPAIDSIKEARELKACVKAHPELKYMMAENCLYWAFIETWREMYREGMLGEAVYAEGAYLHAYDWRDKDPEKIDKSHWRYTYPSIKYVTHSLGPILDITRDRCVSVSCMMPDVVCDPHTAIRKNGIALLKTEKGAVIRILICFDAYAGYGHRFMIIGTEGSIENDNTKPLEEAMSYASLRSVDGSIERKIEIPVTLAAMDEKETRGRGEIKMLGEFVDCIINDTPSPIDIDRAIDISLPGIIAHESALRGGELLEIPLI